MQQYDPLIHQQLRESKIQAAIACIASISTRVRLESWDKSFLFDGNLAACIVENVSIRAEEQLLCKTYSRRSELFRTNHF